MTMLSEAQYAVLGLLTLGDRSGYELSKLAEDNVNLILAPTRSRIYSVLPELRRRGLVTRRDVAQERRPDKQVYRLTNEGQAAFDAWLDDTSKPVTREQLLLKVFFGSRADPEALVEQLRTFVAAKEDELSTLAGHGDANLDEPSADAFFHNLTVACGLELARTQVGWAERAARALELRIRDRESGPVTPSGSPGTNEPAGGPA